MHTELTEWVAAELDFDPKVDRGHIGGRRRRNAARHEISLTPAPGAVDI